MNAPRHGEVARRRTDEARKAHARGWRLTPLNGKKPKIAGWSTLPAPSDEEVEQWASRGNVGVRTGAASGVVVIDDDTPDGSGTVALELPTTPTVITGSGKRHFYFKRPTEGLRNSVRKLAPGVDVRGDGGQVVFVGSIHPDTGKPYCWAPGLSPDEVPLAELPERILALLRDPDDVPLPQMPVVSTTAGHGSRTYALGALRKASATVLNAPEGTRNHALNKAAFSLGRFVGAGLLGREESESALATAAESARLGSAEAVATIRSGLNAGEKKPHDQSAIAARLGRQRPAGQVGDVREDDRVRPLTDTGNAERLVSRFGDDIRFCHPWKKWLSYDGRRWTHSIRGQLMRMSKDVVRDIYKEAAKGIDEDARKEITDWATKSEKADRRRALVDLAASEDGVPVMPDELDKNPDLLNCRNGTLDLRTFALRAPCRADLITKVAPVAYRPGAQCPQWTKFLERVLPDAEVRRFVQRAVGYSLTGDVGEQVLFFCYGLGANGKSVFLRTLLEVLGADYATQAAPDLLLAKRDRAHPTEIADLFGVRLAVCVEAGANRSFDEVLLKQLTGDDRMKARRMREDFWEFSPTHHLWLSANHKPIVRGTDYAIWRRLLLIPFTVQIPEAERDKQLLRKLIAESEGILAWAVEGCREWRQIGLQPPNDVRAATSDYRRDMDALADFLSDRCVALKDARVQASALYSAYQAWAKATGETAETQRAFGSALTERGFERVTIRGLKWYVGLGLKASADAGGTTSGDDGDDGRPSSGIDGLSRRSWDVHTGIGSQSSPSSPAGVVDAPDQAADRPSEVANAGPPCVGLGEVGARLDATFPSALTRAATTTRASGRRNAELDGDYVPEPEPDPESFFQAPEERDE